MIDRSPRLMGLFVPLRGLQNLAGKGVVDLLDHRRNVLFLRHVRIDLLDVDQLRSGVDEGGGVELSPAELRQA